ncbi:MAG TPA: CGNR zinc finger domain-containing protein [Solirubrobacteraceae bacterium]|nr:CGNR zinc finger domain-containing protein [Solirubrobacteraceae bacterium]
MSTWETPYGLDLVIDFVNTLDVDRGADELHSPSALDAWLAGHALTSAPAPSAGDRELGNAVELREALRTLMLANNGCAHGEHAADDAEYGARELELAGCRLERAARRGELGVHFAGGGAVDLAPSADGVDGALARLLVPVARAMADGSWRRVKACRAAACAWAFYDRSRNRSGVWCEMAVCGNRTKVRAYRERSPRPPR